ncbi:hypothetical protein K435DRAFT_812207 [Dendrothele bispora CBS 962.96]|uniref:Uncharacterized protein n=1 Tax=Dendrothele bispora (strain CBS 962.96) TaxID=1314807 RepID=A0A4S8KPR6_DENBC|nr:hypothetical protein K435DRAFT_812207 [Dendrothele bispora CBS 962.96]
MRDIVEIEQAVLHKISTALGTVVKFGTYEVQTLKGATTTAWRHLKKCPYAPTSVKDAAVIKLSGGSTQSVTPVPPLQGNMYQAHSRSPTPVLPLVPPLPISATESIPSLVPRTIPPHPRQSDIANSTPHPTTAPTPVFYGETEPAGPAPMTSLILSEFHADLCGLLVTGLVAWHAVEIPYWRYFFQKWVLDEEVEKAETAVREKVKNRYGTGRRTVRWVEERCKE